MSPCQTVWNHKGHSMSVLLLSEATPQPNTHACMIPCSCNGACGLIALLLSCAVCALFR